MKPDYRVATFVGSDALGTAHSVYVRERPDEDAFLALSRETHDTLVVMGLDEASAPPWAQFFAHGHRVRRCGSGTLAAAWVVREQDGQEGPSSLQLRTSEETLQIFTDTEGFGYESAPLEQHPLDEAFLWQSVVGAPLQGGALCGGENDYTIVELATPSAVCAATPDLSALMDVTKRALILTAREHNRYVLRYFAPQYGQPEGGATGSANVQLLRYWHHQGCRERLFARQCSPSGGEFWGTPGADRVRLFGRVRPVGELPGTPSTFTSQRFRKRR